MALDEYTANAEIIGRDEINDLEGILSVTNTDVDEAIHTVHDNAEAIFTWDYEKGGRPGLNKLYEKAKGAQWNAQTDLPWDTEVDLEKNAEIQRLQYAELELDKTGTPLEKFTEEDMVQLAIESDNWTLSQFMHGEQGALLCTAKIVESVPWIDAKYYAATQVMDEARHVEVFAKYLDEMVEGLALAAFGFMTQMTPDPLLQQLLRYVMSDEARHVAFGVLSLKEYYGGLSDAELREREEFAFEAAVRMRDRFLQQEVWDRMGIKPKEILPVVIQDPGRAMFQQMLFSKIVPNCKKLGLLDAGDGWLRTKFTELGVIQFEDWQDTGEEYESLQATG